MKKNLVSWIYCFLTVILIVIHLYDFVIALIGRTNNISFISNELLILSNLVLLCGIIVYILKKKQLTNRSIRNSLMFLGITRILMSLILPRFYGYKSGSIELLAFKNLNVIDGDLFCRGLILLLLVNLLSELKIENLRR